MIQEKECQESPNDLNDIAHQITDDDHIEIGAQNFRVIRDSRDYFPSRNLIKIRNGQLVHMVKSWSRIFFTMRFDILRSCSKLI